MNAKCTILRETQYVHLASGALQVRFCQLCLAITIHYVHLAFYKRSVSVALIAALAPQAATLSGCRDRVFVKCHCQKYITYCYSQTKLTEPY